MGCEDEVIKIGKKLDKMVANGAQEQAMDLLNALKDLPITLDILQKTRIGMTVNSLRKSTSEDDVIGLAKSLIKSWKKLLPDTPNSKGGNGNGKEPQGENSNGSTTASQSQKKESPKEDPAKAQSASKPSTPKQTMFPADTSNSIRLKCREMLASALKVQSAEEDHSEEELQNADDLAAKIEDCVYEEFGDTNMKYKNRIRSRVANLKDAKNPTLRSNVLRGIIEPSKIAVMTAEEMASEDMKNLRQKFTKEAINDHQMAVTGGTKTDLLRCGKCRKSNCTYNQVQTRSADEPMTTFVYCNECGHRWKFC